MEKRTPGKIRMHPTRSSSNAFPFDLSSSDPHRANAPKPSPRSAPGTRESFPVPPARPNSEPSNRNPWMDSAQSSRFPVPPARPNSVRMQPPSPAAGEARAKKDRRHGGYAMPSGPAHSSLRDIATTARETLRDPLRLASSITRRRTHEEPRCGRVMARSRVIAEAHTPGPSHGREQTTERARVGRLSVGHHSFAGKAMLTTQRQRRFGRITYAETPAARLWQYS